MSEEIKNLAEAIKGQYTEVKSATDALEKRVEENEKKSAESIQEVSEKIDAVVASQEEIKAAVNRPEFSGEKNDNVEAVHKAAFDAFMRDVKTQGEIEIVGKAMSTDSDPDGGYLVRPELANFVVNRVFETSPLRQVARVENIGSKSLEVLVDDQEAGARWIGEGASGGDTSTPQLALKEIVAHKIEADPKITTEQIQDSYLDVEAWLQGKVSDKFARTENTAFINGDGVAKPRGILTYPAWASAGVYERDALEQVSIGASGAITADGLVALQGSLPEEYQANAVFLMKRATYATIKALKGADQFFFGQTFLKDGSPQMLLLGKPVIFCDDMPAVAGDALSVAYGDFSVGYTIADRVGLQVLKDPYTNKGFVTYYTTKRTGGDVTNFQAIKIGKVTA